MDTPQPLCPLPTKHKVYVKDLFCCEMEMEIRNETILFKNEIKFFIPFMLLQHEGRDQLFKFLSDFFSELFDSVLYSDVMERKKPLFLLLAHTHPQAHLL